MSAPLDLDPRLLRLLRDGKRFAILTHINPDGDGLGSQLALWGLLQQQGKEARVLNNDEVPEHYRFLQLAPHAELFAEADAAWIESADGVFVLDNGSVGRLGALEGPVRRARGATVCIDHHETRDNCWDLPIVDEGAAASGEIVYQIIEATGGHLDLAMAEALYVSLITDTGHFRFSKTRPASHRMAARLLESGVRPDRIYECVYERNPEGYLRLMGHALSGLQSDGSGLVWTTLDAAAQERFGATEEDTGGIINTLLSIRGVRASILFKELPDGKVKVSLRSKGEVDVSRLALHHGGGGHRHAAGILLPGPLGAVSAAVLEGARALLAALDKG